MKINRLDAHDRFTYFQRQEFDIGSICQDFINRRPFGEHGFYLFLHKRQIGMDEKLAIFQDDFYMSLQDPTYIRKYSNLSDVPTDRLIWQPRLTKPLAQSNSMLFKVKPGSDNVRVIWMIPAPELWEQYEKGNLTENQTVKESIYKFKNNRSELEAKEADDLSDEAINHIYAELGRAAKQKPFMLVT